MYEYKCKVKRVVDGDTMDVILDLGFSVHHAVRVRMLVLIPLKAVQETKMKRHVENLVKPFLRKVLKVGRLS